MNETDEDILDRIKVCVWSGFYDFDDVQQVIDDILEDDADETFLRATVAPEFEKKAIAEKSWPDETDCDRLDRAFETLNINRIIALQNAGYTMSDGISDVSEELHKRGHNNCDGYCFYHGQDLERAVNGDGLTIAFGDLNNDESAIAKVGQIVKSTLESHGFEIEWDGDPSTRIVIPIIDWKRRFSP